MFQNVFKVIEHKSIEKNAKNTKKVNTIISKMAVKNFQPLIVGFTSTLPKNGLFQKIQNSRFVGYIF